MLGALTGADRALIEYATGHRINRGLDPDRHEISTFAARIAADRAAGRLGPGQEITAVYLKDLNRQYDRHNPDENPITPYLGRALAYVNQNGGHQGVDVRA